jgi:hypothetical protein
MPGAALVDGFMLGAVLDHGSTDGMDDGSMVLAVLAILMEQYSTHQTLTAPYSEPFLLMEPCLKNFLLMALLMV